LPVKPRGSGLLRSHAQEIRACITGEDVKLFSVVIIAVTVVTVALVTVPMVTFAGFDWPTPTHATIFSIADLKSKPERELRPSPVDWKIPAHEPHYQLDLASKVHSFPKKDYRKTSPAYLCCDAYRFHCTTDAVDLDVEHDPSPLERRGRIFASNAPAGS